MKMMRKNWKDRKGVSPVIATILMVAITVVLAAVLYVMVMGFGGDGGEQAPTVTTTKNTADKRIVISVSEAAALDQFQIQNGTDSAVDLVAGPVVGLTFVSADDKLNTGDYFAYTAGTEGTYNLLWINGDESRIVATFTI